MKLDSISLGWLSHNELTRLFLRYWQAPLLAVMLLGILFGGTGGLRATAAAALAVSAFSFGVCWIAHARVRRAEAALASDRSSGSTRFLCPACLTLGEFLTACPGCRTQVEPWIEATGGEIVSQCGNCGRRLPPVDPSALLLALCGRCDSTGELATWHGRRIRLLGTLNEGDLDTLASRLNGERRMDQGIRYCRADDGQTWTYVLNLGDLGKGRAELPQGHAAGAVEALWVRSPEPLALAEALDRLAARAQLGEDRLRSLRVAVGGGPLDPAAGRALSARIAAEPVYVGPDEFLNCTGSNV